VRSAARGSDAPLFFLEVKNMCVAYPGTVLSLKDGGKVCSVDFGGTRVDARTGFIPVKEGDHVLIHAGCVLQVLKEEDAAAMEEIFNDIAEIENEEKPYEKDLGRSGKGEPHDAP